MLNNLLIEEHIKNALKEDIGFEDISTDQMDIKEFNKTLFEIENKYGFYSCKSLINEKELKEHIQKTRRQK